MTDDYEFGEIVSANDVPSWARRTPKWQPLVEKVGKLLPGQTLTVYFDNEKAAYRARNTVRDMLNLSVGRAVVRTRVIESGERFKVFFTRLHDEQVVEQVRHES